MPTPDALVTIRTFTNATEAQLARSALATHGIEAFLADENMVAMDWLYSNAVGGVKLKVHRVDVQQAESILSPDQESPPWTSSEVPQAGPSPHCPRCGSDWVRYEGLSRQAVLAGLLLIGFPFIFMKRRWICQKCGQQWKKSPDR